MSTYPSNEETAGRVLRMGASLKMLGVSRALIYRKLSPKDKLYDPTFPRQVKLSSRAVGFLEDELQVWLQSRDRR